MNETITPTTMPEQSIKQRLRLCLYAGDVLVADSDDIELWQEALTKINAKLSSGCK